MATARGIAEARRQYAASGLLPPIPPGEILAEEFLAPLGLSANALARALGVPTNRITAILNGTRSITADTALRLARHFGTTPRFWLNLQAAHDLDFAERASGATIAARVRSRTA
ncbi:MAG: HigA family addiction module antidote protein [Alphaproteobacteria bacterium]|nr:HigA family addiction module antidote protein [Alphaproteobacteria bacterium]